MLSLVHHDQPFNPLSFTHNNRQHIPCSRMAFCTLGDQILVVALVATQLPVSVLQSMHQPSQTSVIVATYIQLLAVMPVLLQQVGQLIHRNKPEMSPGRLDSSSMSSSSSRSYRKATKHIRSERIITLATAAAAVDDEDLMQFPDRWKWYEAKFAADDMPDWVPGQFISSSQQAPHWKLITFSAEISRQRVPLRNAYKAAGQKAVVRVNGGEARRLHVASGPHSELLNQEALFLCKGDIFSGETKTQKEPTSVMAEVQVLVHSKEAPEVYNMGSDDLISVGPFEGTGVDLRSQGVMGVFRYPTIVIFASGAGIATAAALIESPVGVSTHLSPTLRSDVRLYYSVPNRASLCLADRFSDWEEQYKVVVVPTTSGFMDAWDGDDTLVYDPEMTAAIILTDGDKEAEAAALEVCKEAEITAIVMDSKPAAPPVFLEGTPKSFLKFRRDPSDASAAAVMAAGAAAAGIGGAADSAQSSVSEELAD